MKHVQGEDRTRLKQKGDDKEWIFASWTHVARNARIGASRRPARIYYIRKGKRPDQYQSVAVAAGVLTVYNVHSIALRGYVRASN